MKREETKFIVIHCSASKPSQDWGVLEIDRMHRKRGWAGVGYHYIIKRDGDVEPGREYDDVGAHVKGLNRVSIGICLIGGLNEETGKPENNFTDDQFYSLYLLLTGNVVPKYPEAQLLGHRDLSPDIDGDGVIEEWEWLKMCPCFDAGDWWRTAQQYGISPV